VGKSDIFDSNTLATDCNRWWLTTEGCKPKSTGYRCFKSGKKCSSKDKPEHTLHTDVKIYKLEALGKTMLYIFKCECNDCH
jgi:hypothetical protein